MYTGADINASNKRGNTSLIYAVYYQLHKAVDFFTKTEKISLDVNAKNINGKTALHYAATVDNGGIATTLLVSGADIFATDKTGNTPVHTACKCGSEKVLKLIIKRRDQIKKIIDDPNGEGNTPLMLAKSASKYSYYNFELLKNYGAKLQVFNGENNCILHFYSKIDDPDVNEKILSTNGTLLFHKNCDEETPLHIAAKCGHKDTCLLYVNKYVSHTLECFMHICAHGYFVYACTRIDTQYLVNLY